MPNETLRSVLIQGAERYRNGELSAEQFEQGLVMAIAECPYNQEKVEDLSWLAAKLTSQS